MDEQVDVVVLGMGPGGEEVAGALAQAGLAVVGIDKELLGGECPYWGCIPSKMMIRAANLLAEARRIPGMAGDAIVQPDWAPVARRIREEATDSWDDRVAVERFEGKGGRFVRGQGRLSGPRSVTVDGRTFTARRALVIGTGTVPFIPPILGLQGTPYWTNRHAIEAEQVPESLIALGGGAVSVELGQVFARFGSRVTIVEAMDRLVPAEEPEACALIQTALRDDGIDVRTGAAAATVAHDGQHFTVVLADGSHIEGERLLVATGRRADLRPLDLAAAGLDASGRWITVDDRLRAADGIWAVGDITGRGAFTHVAIYQARIATADILGRPTPRADYRALPRVTFTDPEVGSVGLTEQAARDQGIAVRTGIGPVPKSARGWIHKAGNSGFIKLVEDSSRGVMVGATSAGPVGGEVLSILALAVHAEVPTATLRDMIYAYPTFHRGIEDALSDLLR